MGQHEIIQVLKKRKEPLTAREIAEECGVNKANISSNLQGLIRHRMIKREIVRLPRQKPFNGPRRRIEYSLVV